MSWIAKTGIFLCLLATPIPGFCQNRTGVEVGTLSEINPFSIGVLSREQGRLPDDVWQNSSPQVLRDLLEEVPVEGGSPLINDLVARLLISGGKPPNGGPAIAELAQLRLAGAYAYGRLLAVTQITARSPGGIRQPETAALAVNAFLARGQIDQACAISKAQIEARAASYWLQLRAFCLAMDGNIAGAELTAELAGTADPDDGSFVKQINRLTSAPDKPINVTVHSALELAVSEAAHDTISTQDLPLNLAVALGLRQDPDTLQVLIDAYAMGAVSTKPVIQKLLDRAAALQTPSTEAQENTPTDIDVEIPSPLKREQALLEQAQTAIGADRLALLLALGRGADTTQIRAKALALILEEKSDYLHWLARHRLVIDEIRYIPLDPEYADVAPDFARAALISGDRELARQWIQISEPKAIASHALDIGLQIIGGRIRMDEISMHDRMSGTEKQRLQALDHLMILMALDEPLPAQYRQWVSRQPNKAPNECDSNRLLALDQSAKARATAETILRAADWVRSDGFDTLSAQCSLIIVSSLQRVGLQTEARGAALEWLFSQQAMTSP